MKNAMKRVLVTGANKGIGLAIAEQILEAADDTFVFLGSRDQGRGDAAAASLEQSNPRMAGRIHVLALDVGSEASVTSAADEVRAICGDAPLYGIVNNAGIGLGSENLADVLNVNTRGIKRVCDAFFPMLGEGGRVVNITSASGPNFVATCDAEKQAVFTNPHVTWDEINALMAECESIAGDAGAFASRGLGNGAAYGLSKACSNAYNQYLANQHPNLVINACTPGFIATDLTLGYRTQTGQSADDLGMKQPRDGAASAIFLLFGEPQGSGHYYGSDAKRSPLDRYRAPGSPAYTGE